MSDEANKKKQELEGAGDTGNSGEGAKTPPDKTFTQEEVNAIAAKEKKQGINSVYSQLGFESAEQAQEMIKKWREDDDKKKTDLERAQSENSALQKDRDAAVNKAQMLERKMQAIELGAQADNAEDIVVLAASKVTDDKDFAKALEEVKTAYPAMFGKSEQGKGGTGGAGNPPRDHGNSGESSIGKRLAEQRKTNVPKQSYFSN